MLHAFIVIAPLKKEQGPTARGRIAVWAHDARKTYRTVMGSRTDGEQITLAIALSSALDAIDVLSLSAGFEDGAIGMTSQPLSVVAEAGPSLEYPYWIRPSIGVRASPLRTRLDALVGGD